MNMIAASAEVGRLMVIKGPDFRAALSVRLLFGGAQGSPDPALSAPEMAPEMAAGAVFDDETDT